MKKQNNTPSPLLTSPIRGGIMLLIALFIYSLPNGEVFAQFYGGNADGHSMTANETYIAACVLPAYTNISAGGNADGYSMTANETYVAACVLPVYTNISAGGNADGASMIGPVTCYTITVVPIQLLTFTAECLPPSTIPFKNGYVLNWQTATEINNDYFTIERTNGSGSNSSNWQWQVIGTVNGSGNSSVTKSYTFSDHYSPSLFESGSGTLYYRLKQTDYDGKFEYFGPISVSNCGSFNIISIYPNPANEYIQYILGSEDGGEVTVKLYDALGREVFSKEETISAGIFKEKISTVNFRSGSYLLRITNGNKEKTQKQFVIK